MIDVHCHMQFHSYKKDADQVIKEALGSGVNFIVNTGTSLSSSESAVELSEKYEKLYAIVGIHPHEAERLQEGWDKKLLKIAKSSKKVIGIGEIGLDYFKRTPDEKINKEAQKDLFKRQIEIAIELGLPLQIHNRQAGDDLIKILKTYKNDLKNIPGMFHCMSGNVNFLKQVLGLGFFIGFDGNITYEGIAKGEDTPLPELVKNTPIERIVTETDAPFLTPIPFRGSRNEPKHVIIVGEEVAKIKELDVSFVEEQTTKNAGKIFNVDFL